MRKPLPLLDANRKNAPVILRSLIILVLLTAAIYVAITFILREKRFLKKLDQDYKRPRGEPRRSLYELALGRKSAKQKLGTKRELR